MSRKTRKRLHRLLALSAIVFLVTVALHLRGRSPTRDPSVATGTVVPLQPEIAAIVASRNLDEQVVQYKKLIARVGPVEAQEALLKSGLAFDGQTHLLNHTVGNVLYETYGTEGLSLCRDYFLSSCYHGFVIRAVGDGGMDTLARVVEACVPKGNAVTIQCAHAIGHGFLAWVGYKNLLAALATCDTFAARSKNFPVYNCHDGVFMENIWAVHQDGRPSPDRWLKDEDPVYPCSDPRIAYRYRQACWSNQPMRLYQMFGGDISRVGSYCLGVADRVHQETCFDGLARQIHPVTGGSTAETFRLCALVPPAWRTSCIYSIVKAGFSVGDRETPYALCRQVEADSQEGCHRELFSIIAAYAQSEAERRQWCDRIDEPRLRHQCLSWQPSAN